MKINFKNLNKVFLFNLLLFLAGQNISAMNDLKLKTGIDQRQFELIKTKLFNAISNNKVEEIEIALSKMIKAGMLSEGLSDLILLEACKKVSEASKLSIASPLFKCFSKLLISVSSTILGIAMLNSSNHNAESAVVAGVGVVFAISFFNDALDQFIAAIKIRRDSTLAKKILSSITLKLKQAKAYAAKKSKENQIEKRNQIAAKEA